MDRTAVPQKLPLRPRAFWPVLALLALVAAAKPIVIDTLDPDLFWHLRVADQLAHEGIHPLVDHISFTAQATPWTPYSWLAELAMKSLWDAGGYRAILLAHALLLALLVLAVGAAALEAVARSATRACAAALVATGAGLIYILPWLSFRPAACTLLILATIMWLIQRDRRLGETSAMVWLVPPLAALAINMHLFAFVAPCWVAALLAGALWEKYRSHYSPPRAAQHRVRRYGILLGLTLAACGATPLLPGVIQTAWYYHFGDPLVASNFIAEMQPFYHGRFGLVLVLVLALLGWSMLRGASRVRPGDWLMLAQGATLLAEHGRFAPLFALTLVPVVTLTLGDVSDRLLARRPVAGAAWALLVAGVVALGAVFPGTGESLDTWINRKGPEKAGYPAAAASFVLAHVQPQQHRVINEFTWGGYLAWRLGDQYQVLMDGRTQIRPAAFWQTACLGGPRDRAQLLADTPADAAILPTENSLFHEILVQQGWRQVYADKRAVVLLPFTEVSALHLHSYRIDTAAPWRVDTVP